MDRVEHDKLVQYCRDVEERIRQIKSNDLSGEENPLPEELSLSFFICSKNIEDDQKQLSGFGIRTQIRQFFVYRDLADEKRNNRDPVQEYRRVQSQEGGFCDERMHTATTYDNDKSDFSGELLSYQSCVCSPPNEESFTKKMAYCFAKTQGLVLVEDNAEFLERLQKSSVQKNPDLAINGEHLVQHGESK